MYLRYSSCKQSDHTIVNIQIKVKKKNQENLTDKPLKKVTIFLQLQAKNVPDYLKIALHPQKWTPLIHGKWKLSRNSLSITKCFVWNFYKKYKNKLIIVIPIFFRPKLIIELLKV